MCQNHTYKILVYCKNCCDCHTNVIIFDTVWLSHCVWWEVKQVKLNNYAPSCSPMLPHTRLICMLQSTHRPLVCCMSCQQHQPWQRSPPPVTSMCKFTTDGRGFCVESTTIIRAASILFVKELWCLWFYNGYEQAIFGTSIAAVRKYMSLSCDVSGR